MTQKVGLICVFLLSVGLFYFASPTWACGTRSECVITCYDASGHQIGNPVSCDDYIGGQGVSCSCDTDYLNNGTAACHSHCTTHTGQDEYCTY